MNEGPSNSERKFPKIHRRSLLGLGASYIGLKLSSILIPNTHKGKDIFVSKEIDPTGFNPEVYKKLTFSENPLGFFNIGVLHDDALLPYYREKIYPKIDEADIVLLEYPVFPDDGTDVDGWFTTFANYARTEAAKKDRQEKIIEELDFHNTLSNGVKMIFTSLAGVAALKSIVDSMFDIKPEDSDYIKFRTYLLTILGLDYFANMPKSELAGHMLSALAGREKARYNFDFRTDGRTIFMLLRILKIIEDNPGKKIVVITGDAHAEMFDVYAKDKDLKEFKIKSFIYDIIYRPQKILGELRRKT